ncbi:MAG: asparagine synthase (glutamine-hydrolyzing) [Candidatus Obscuribacterales bacterium]|nr:asparagine synthase (glutamine-hydrolyzing) [Candidatus Obscuribacterales bacterium]
MCGIAGWLSWNEPVRTECLEAMTREISHRGPDAHGIQVIGPAGLGHRRLSIIDTSTVNNQPLCDTAGKFWIAFNGEIYNFQEIRSKLESEGVHFQTKGDTEVVLEAYKAYGVECVHLFTGMFAFAIWDTVREILFMARDRAGEKPLFYYTFADGSMIWASEPNALLKHPEVGARVNPAALAQFLSLNYTVGDDYLVQGVKRLRPGCYLVAERGKQPVTRSYWDFAASFKNKREGITENEAGEELNALLSKAVSGCMISDVPLGAFLSGGIDSSCIVSNMTLNAPPQTVKTFCIGFRENSFDESAQAKFVANHFGADHRERFLSESVDTVMRALLWASREPLADSSFLPTFSLAEFTREHVTVALSGDGGDECFSGYVTYSADKMHNMFSGIPSPLVRALYAVVDNTLPVSMKKVSFDYKLRHFLKGLAHPLDMAHNMWRGIFSEEERLALLRPEFHSYAKDEVVFGDMLELWHELDGCHFLDQAMYVDIKTWLPDNILVKVDRATMAHSLESRAPFLDHKLMEFAASLPVDLRMKGFNKKYLLKKAQSNRVPQQVMQGKKQGFSSPVSLWLSGPLRQFRNDLLMDPFVREWFNRSAIEAILRDHDAGRRDNGLKIFGLVCLVLWLRSLHGLPAVQYANAAGSSRSLLSAGSGATK